MPKTIIITGASRGKYYGAWDHIAQAKNHTFAGIGEAIARYLLHEGNNVVVLARSTKPLEDLKAEYPNQVRVLAGDMADFSIASKAVEITEKEFRQIDGLIINHGMLPPVTRIVDTKLDEWKHNFDVNFFSAIAFVSPRSIRSRNETHDMTGSSSNTSPS